MSRQAKIDVTINGEQAKARLAEIKEDLKQIKILRDKAAAEGDTKGYSQLNNEMKKLTAEARKLERASFDVNSVLKNMSGASQLELENALRAVNREMKEMKRNDPGLLDKKAQAAALSTELDKLKGKATQSGMSFGKIADGFNKYFGMATALVATFTGVIFGFKKSIDEFNQFEKKVDNLSALTGLTGENLEYLTEQARNLSTETIQGNIRITKSADAIVDAYTKVGSKRPELLANKEALNEVTKEAMILASAADSELDPAVDALTMTLNQFNASADDSRRIINVLAAGSKFGAGNIPYLTTAIEKSGTVASDANISIEELVGTIETLAPRMTAPEQAGTGLRNVILKLQQSTDDVNPAIKGLLPSLDNLAKKNLSVAEMSKLVGLENITVLKILMNNRDELQNYTAAVTGTSIALEQAATNTDNNASKLEQARNKAALMRIELGEKLAPALTFSTNSFSYLVKGVLATIKVFNDNRSIILSTLSAIAAYTVIVYGATAAKKIYTAVVNIATVAVKAFNVASKSSPFGLIAGAIAFAVTSWITLKDQIKSTTKEQEAYNDIQAETKRRTVEEVGEMKRLFDAIRDQNTSQEVRKVLIKDINEKYKDYLPNLLTEESTLYDINKAYTNVNKAMREKIEFMVKESKARETYLKIYELELEFEQIAAQSAAEYNKENGIVEGVRGAARSRALNNLREDMKELSALYEKIMSEINYGPQNHDYSGGRKTKDDDDGGGGGGGGGGDKKLKTKYENLSADIAKAKKELEAYAASGDSANSKVAGALLKQLEGQKHVIDGIIKAGGNVETYLEGLTDSTFAELEEQNKDWTEFYKTLEPEAKRYYDNLADLQKLKTEGEIASIIATQEAHEKSIEDRIKKEEEWRKAGIDIASDLANAGFDIYSDRLDKKTDAQLSALDRQRNNELKNEKLTEEQREAIDKKFRAQEAKIKLEAWKKQKQADVISSLIKTALAVVNQLSGGDPITAPIRAIAAGATGLIQTGIIIAKKPPEFKSGGFTDKSLSDDTPVGEVHANEFVNNADAVRNPTIKPILDIIDYAQRAGTVRTINLPALIASKEKQLKSGGYTSAADQNSASLPLPADFSESAILATALNNFTKAVDKLQSEGIEANAKWVYQDFKKLQQKEESAINDTV
jgi:TP901 family phage tail tape measure protein